ncbi:MAG: hypothetical protein HN348_00340 [Proteobacteria bacterium]|nr:hypothetical protein [Pseudomonadota bacterium]
MGKLVFAWGAISIYVIITLGLTWWGWRRTNSISSFATGGGKLSPWIVGLSLAAQLTSVALSYVLGHLRRDAAGRCTSHCLCSQWSSP